METTPFRCIIQEVLMVTKELKNEVQVVSKELRNEFSKG